MSMSKQLSTVAIPCFQFALYHVVAPFSFLRCSQPCMIVKNFSSYPFTNVHYRDLLPLLLMLVAYLRQGYMLIGVTFEVLLKGNS